jgi:hypothetical protein
MALRVRAVIKDRLVTKAQLGIKDRLVLEDVNPYPFVKQERL